MKESKRLIELLIAIAVLAFMPGCKGYPDQSFPTYQSQRSADGQWSVVIDDEEYVLWPDQDWILLSDETGSKIGYLDSSETSLYTIVDDIDRNFIKVAEAGADVLHVPLVKESLKEEFSLDHIDAIEWTNWGIHAENLKGLIGADTTKDPTAIDRFVAYFNEWKEDSLSGKWVSAGTIYCYNSNLPDVVYALDTEYYNGNIKCSGYNSPEYVIIPQRELEDILGPMPEME
jgi:hypothetical protein